MQCDEFIKGQLAAGRSPNNAFCRGGCREGSCPRSATASQLSDRAATLPIGRWTRYHFTNMATHIFFQGVGTFSGRLRRYVSEVHVFLLCFFVHGTKTHSFPVRLLLSKLPSRGLVNIVVVWCILLLSAVNIAVVWCILLSGVHYCCLFYHTSQTKHSSVFSVTRWRVWQN